HSPTLRLSLTTMVESLSPRWRAVVNSLAYSVLVALVAGLGYMTFRAVSERRHGAEAAGSSATGSGDATEPSSVPLVEFDNFSTRREKSSDSERLHVSLRLRLNASGNMDCFVFVLARNDHASPKLWAVWPTQGPGGAITGGGHLSGSNPAGGQAVTLAARWTGITATLDHPLGKPPFDTVMVYVVSPKGEILLARPFAL
ncbi:MAG: hypothetical protein ACHQ4J_17210, partial [Candidatus Binatia bacterium]